MKTPLLKTKVLAIPFVGYGLRVMNNIIRSPLYLDRVSDKLNEITDILQQAKSSNKATATNVANELETIGMRVDNLIQLQDNMEKRFMLIEKNKTIHRQSTVGVAKDDKALFADDHLLDVFYTDFEDRFRGSEEMILERLSEYTDNFKNAIVNFNKYPVLDIGSGRGEFLQLLKSLKIPAEGLDINIDMVDRSNTKGLKTTQGDALDFLQSQPSQTYGAITGFHIVEHIPFSDLLRIFKSAHQALAKDGFVLFETPNPENIIVGSCAFYMDPSHLHPIPPDLLAFALETSGFRNIEIRRLHPVPEYEPGDLPSEVINRLYGPRDYAVIGYK